MAKYKGKKGFEVSALVKRFYGMIINWKLDCKILFSLMFAKI